MLISIMLNKDYIVTHIKSNPWDMPTVRLYLLALLDRAKSYNREREINQVDGRIISTLNVDSITHNDFLQNQDLNILLEEIKIELLNSSKVLTGEQWEDLDWYRIWCNAMYQDSSVKEHSHGFDGLVAIFYLSVPENSAKLILTNVPIAPKNNGLVIHNGNIQHWVSKHQSEEPRIVLIVEAIKKII